MRTSELILPLRIYTDLYDQQRFNVHCSTAEQYRMVYPQNALPHFQYFKEGPGAAPTDFYLRKLCADFETEYRKIIPELQSNFGDDDFYTFTQAGFVDNDGGPHSANQHMLDLLEVRCGKLTQIVIDPVAYIASGNYAKMVIPLPTPIAKFHFKMVVEKFYQQTGSSFSIKVYTGGTSGTLLDTITKSGIYNYDFTSASDDITVVFNAWEVSDEFEISYVQVTWATLDGTMILNETELKNVHVAADKDITAFCRPANADPYIVAPGDYYYVINDGGVVYYSEVFTIVSYKEIENYYILTWYNDTDLAGLILYSGDSIDCTYRNFLYLDAALFKPEPDTLEDEEPNGDGNANPVFKSWKKSINLEILKCPEFLSDALSAVFLHGNVFLTPPLNRYQDVRPDAITVKRVTPEVSSVLNDCFQKVNLKLLLQEYYTESNCGENITIIP